MEKGRNDLATTHPAIASEWDHKRNAPLTPSDLSFGSDRKVFWICSAGHSYEASVSGRAGSKGRGCAICAGKKVLAGFNDLATTNPDIASQWDYERNAPLTPMEVSKASHKKVFWLCKEKHSHQATIASRTRQVVGCRTCSGQQVLAGFNDLATTHPEIASEWDYQKNSPLTPEQVSKGANRKVFWNCSEGHSFEALVSSRAIQGTGCATCSGRKVLAGFNDLATTHPAIASQWDYETNAPYKPEQFSKGSSESFSWICPKGHRYKTSIIAKTYSETGCRKCVQRRVVSGSNDLATTHPELLSEWDFEKNVLYSPSELSRGSDQKVSWLCPKGHSYQASLAARVNRGVGCSVCAGQTVQAGFNDLATTHPEIASEWDYETNSPLTPLEVPKGSNLKVSWLCPKGHSYQMRTADRTSGKACSVCANKIIIPGVNDLASLHPELVDEWDYERNNPLSPTRLSRGSVKKVFWICPKGHSYKAIIVSRTSQQTGCSICAGKEILRGFNDLATTHPEIASEWDYEKNAPVEPTQIPAGTGKSFYWLCPEGHSYRSVVGSRTNIGTGCPRCNIGGFDATQAGLFYFLMSTSLSARKIGITNTERRYDRIAAYGSGWEVVFTTSHDDGQLVRDLETQVLRWLRKDVGLPPYLGKEEMGAAGGHTETFSMEGVSNREVLTKIRGVLKSLEQDKASRLNYKKRK